MLIAFLVVAAFLLACLIRLVFVAVRGQKLPKEQLVLYLPLLPCFLIAAILGEEVLRHRNAELLCVFLLLWLCYCGVMVLLTAQKLLREQNAAQEQVQVERHYAQQEEYYDRLLQKQEQTRALWHDMEKYLHAAEAERGEGPAIVQARQALSEARDLVDVGNHVLNVILNEYQTWADAASVRLDLSVQVPPELFVTAADLYILLGNTLDNALEACMLLPEAQREITLQLRQHNDMLFYRIANPYRPSSAKQDRSPLHGYGLKNVRQCVKKYHGSMEVTQENGRYTVIARLNRG